MKLLFLTSGPEVPGTRFRVLQYVPRLQQLGHQCVVAHSRPAKYTHWPWLGWRLSMQCREWLRRLDLLRAQWGRFDVVFLERELFDGPSDQFEFEFRRIAKRFVLDVDDGIFLKHPEKFARVAGFSDHVIAGNERIAVEARRFSHHVTTIPTVIDLDGYPAPVSPRDTVNAPVVIGWIGTRSNLSYLELLAPALERLARRHRFEWQIVTDSQGLCEIPQIPGVTTRAILWTDSTEIEALGRFDIGVMPLRDEPWTRFKCGCKLIQYMAIGAAAVASPVGVNSEIADSGRAALLAETSQDWETQLERLLVSSTTRRELALIARQRVAERYCLQAVFPAWLKAVLGELDSVQK